MISLADKRAGCFLAVFLFSANMIFAAEDTGVTRYVRFTDNTGTHSGILEGQSIRVLDGDPIFEDGVNPTGRTVELRYFVLVIRLYPVRVSNVMGFDVFSINRNANSV